MRGKSKLIAAAVQEALDEGNAAPDVLDNMIKAMGVVGEKFKNNEIFVPEMLVAARAMKKRCRCSETTSCRWKRWCSRKDDHWNCSREIFMILAKTWLQ